MVRYRRAALVLLAALLLAGCTALPGQDGGTDEETQRTIQRTPNDGLSLSFRAASGTFPENEVLQFNVQADNTGDYDADITSVEVFGSPFLDIGGRCQQMPLSTGQTLLKQSPGPRFTWRCRAPLDSSQGGATAVDLPTGATNTFTAGLRVRYTYETTARTSVRVVTPSRLDGGAPVTTENTAGPVHADINVQSPRSATESGTLRVPVTIRNVGDGEVVDGKVTIDDIQVDDSDVSVSSTGVQNPVHLVNGKRQVVLELSGFGLGENDLEKTVDIRLQLDYTYEEQKTTTFTVQGQPDGVDVEAISESAAAQETAPTFVLQPQNGQMMRTGAVDVSVSSSFPGTITIDSYYTGSALPQQIRNQEWPVEVVSGSVSSGDNTYTIAATDMKPGSVDPLPLGTYRLEAEVVSGKTGDEYTWTRTVEVVQEPEPSFTLQPADRTVAPDGSFTVSMDAGYAHDYRVTSRYTGDEMNQENPLKILTGSHTGGSHDHSIDVQDIKPPGANTLPTGTYDITVEVTSDETGNTYTSSWTLTVEEGEEQSTGDKELQFVVERTDTNTAGYQVTIGRRPWYRPDTLRINVDENNDESDGYEKTQSCADEIDAANGDYTCDFQGTNYQTGVRYSAQVRDWAGNIYFANDTIQIGGQSYPPDDDAVLGVWTEPQQWTDDDGDGETDSAIVINATLNPDRFADRATVARFRPADGGFDFDSEDAPCTADILVADTVEKLDDAAKNSRTTVSSGDGFHRLSGGRYTSGEGTAPAVRVDSYSCGSDRNFICLPADIEVSDGTTTDSSTDLTCYADGLAYRAAVKTSGGQDIQDTGDGTGRVAVQPADGSGTLGPRDMPATFSFPTDSPSIGIGDGKEFHPLKLYGCTQPLITVSTEESASDPLQCGSPSVRSSFTNLDQGNVPVAEQFSLSVSVRHIARDVSRVEITRVEASNGETTDLLASVGDGDVSCSPAGCEATVEDGVVVCTSGSSASNAPCTVDLPSIDSAKRGGTLTYEYRYRTADMAEGTFESGSNSRDIQD